MLDYFKKLFGSRKRKRIDSIDPKPKHVAVIMDGNGRWANSQGLSRVAGHRRGVESVKSLINSCIKHEIPTLSIFAFSSENWSRPQSEVQALMEILANGLETQTKKLSENGVCLQFLGDLSRFDDRIQRLAVDAQRQSCTNDKLILNVAINYGGRWDITKACKALAERVDAGELSSHDINEDLINQQLSTSGMPDPDLVIRTSGEYRISNFLLWQAAYSEFYFTDVLWPDFDEQAFEDALLTFTHRNRRFGNAEDAVPGGHDEAANFDSDFKQEGQSRA